MDKIELGHKILFDFKFELKEFIQILKKDLILYSVEQKINSDKIIKLNENLNYIISDFLFYYQKYFDLHDFCENETIIIYKSYERYLKLRNQIKYIDLMLKSKQIKINKEVYKQCINVLNMIFDEYKNHKNEVKNLKDLDTLYNFLNTLRIVNK